MIVQYQGGWGGQKYIVVVAVQLAFGSLKRQFSLHAAVYICHTSTLDVYVYRRIVPVVTHFAQRRHVGVSSNINLL